MVVGAFVQLPHNLADIPIALWSLLGRIQISKDLLDLDGWSQHLTEVMISIVSEA